MKETEMNQQNASEEKVFINGKKQVIDLFHNLGIDHKNRLLESIKAKNPKLAMELKIESLSFRDIKELDNHQLSILLSFCNPTVIGITLKICQVDFQKRALKLIHHKEKAIEAFQHMKRDVSPMDTDRACLKMVFILKELVATKKLVIN